MKQKEFLIKQFIDIVHNAHYYSEPIYHYQCTIDQLNEAEKAMELWEEFFQFVIDHGVEKAKEEYRVWD